MCTCTAFLCVIVSTQYQCIHIQLSVSILSKLLIITSVPMQSTSSISLSFFFASGSMLLHPPTHNIVPMYVHCSLNLWSHFVCIHQSARELIIILSFLKLRCQRRQPLIFCPSCTPTYTETLIESDFLLLPRIRHHTMCLVELIAYVCTITSSRLLYWYIHSGSTRTVLQYIDVYAYQFLHIYTSIPVAGGREVFSF